MELEISERVDENRELIRAAFLAVGRLAAKLDPTLAEESGSHSEILHAPPPLPPTRLGVS